MSRKKTGILLDGSNVVTTRPMAFIKDLKKLLRKYDRESYALQWELTEANSPTIGPKGRRVYTTCVTMDGTNLATTKPITFVRDLEQLMRKYDPVTFELKWEATAE